MSRAFALATDTGPALASLEMDAPAQAAWLGHSHVTHIHLLLSVLALEEQMLATGYRPAPAYANTNGLFLADHGVEHRAGLAAAETFVQSGEVVQPQKRRRWRTNPRSPRWTVVAARAADSARELSASQRRVAGSVHLVHAVLSDPDDSARRLLVKLSADPAEILKNTGRRLGISD